jgi:DNA-binding NarL/FixJ family response regulator
VKILVMDDAPEVRERIVELLAPLLDGVDEIIEAGDIVTALHLITLYKPPILILDIRVPGGNGLRNGIDLLRHVKVERPTTKVIMCSNFAVPQFRTQCINAGAEYFLDKSNEFDQLLPAVETLIGRVS